MTAATQDIITPRYGAEDQVLPDLLQPGVAANTIIYGGTLVMLLAGLAQPAGPSTSGPPGIVLGRCQRQVDNRTTNTPYGAAGAQQVLVDRGAFWLNLAGDSTVSTSSFGANVYAVDDNTVSLNDGGGSRPYVGYLLSIPTTPGIPGSVNMTGSAKVAVQVGQPNPWAANPELSFAARNVVTSLAAYVGSGTNVLTASANGAWAAQDGVTNAVGDIVFFPEGTTNLTAALDAGPWQITSLGGAAAKWTVQRPSWWTTGTVMPLAAVIEIGGEGTFWKGTSWKSFAAVGSAVIGTNDPDFYPREVTQQVTFAASTFTLNNVPMRSATQTLIECAYTGTGAIAGTIGYGPAGAITPGYLGTATVTLDALASGMGKNGTTDVGVVNVTVINW